MIFLDLIGGTPFVLCGACRHGAADVTAEKGRAYLQERTGGATGKEGMTGDQ